MKHKIIKKKNGVGLIAQERARRIKIGYDKLHDMQHPTGAFVNAAAVLDKLQQPGKIRYWECVSTTCLDQGLCCGSLCMCEHEPYIGYEEVKWKEISKEEYYKKLNIM